MSDPIEVHKRLMAQLPVRTHQLSDAAPNQALGPEKKRLRRPWSERKHGPMGVGSGGSNRQAVRVRGQLFPSLTDACKMLGIHRSTMSIWIRDGIAKLEVKK